MASPGCTGRGRGIPKESIEQVPVSIGRGRGRGILDPESASEIPPLSSLKINSITNGYVEDIKPSISNGSVGDVKSDLERVTSKKGNIKDVIAVLTKWLELAELNFEKGEAVATVVCDFMSHTEYGDQIREFTLKRIFQMYQDCKMQKYKSLDKLITSFSFMGFMYLIQRQNDGKRMPFFIQPLVLFIKEILKMQLTVNVVRHLTKQISINAIAINANPAGRSDLEDIFKSIRSLLISNSIDSNIRCYLLYLCDLQCSDFGPVPKSVSKFYTEYFEQHNLDSFKPLDVDIKLYKTK